MILSTTQTIEGQPIQKYLGIVTGEAIIGANVWKDFKASMRDFFGGRSSAYEKVLCEAREAAQHKMETEAMKLCANAVVGIDFDYEAIGQSNTMLMVSCSGTAVVL